MRSSRRQATLPLQLGDRSVFVWTGRRAESTLSYAVTVSWKESPKHTSRLCERYKKRHYSMAAEEAAYETRSAFRDVVAAEEDGPDALIDTIQHQRARKVYRTQPDVASVALYRTSLQLAAIGAERSSYVPRLRHEFMMLLRDIEPVLLTLDPFSISQLINALQIASTYKFRIPTWFMRLLFYQSPKTRGSSSHHLWSQFMVNATPLDVTFVFRNFGRMRLPNSAYRSFSPSGARIPPALTHEILTVSAFTKIASTFDAKSLADVLYGALIARVPLPANTQQILFSKERSPLAGHLVSKLRESSMDSDPFVACLLLRSFGAFGKVLPPVIDDELRNSTLVIETLLKQTNRDKVRLFIYLTKMIRVLSQEWVDEELSSPRVLDAILRSEQRAQLSSHDEVMFTRITNPPEDVQKTLEEKALYCVPRLCQILWEANLTPPLAFLEFLATSANASQSSNNSLSSLFTAQESLKLLQALCEYPTTASAPQLRSVVSQLWASAFQNEKRFQTKFYPFLSLRNKRSKNGETPMGNVGHDPTPAGFIEDSANGMSLSPQALEAYVKTSLGVLHCFVKAKKAIDKHLVKYLNFSNKYVLMAGSMNILLTQVLDFPMLADIVWLSEESCLPLRSDFWIAVFGPCRVALPGDSPSINGHQQRSDTSSVTYANSVFWVSTLNVNRGILRQSDAMGKLLWGLAKQTERTHGATGGLDGMRKIKDLSKPSAADTLTAFNWAWLVQSGLLEQQIRKRRQENNGVPMATIPETSQRRTNQVETFEIDAFRLLRILKSMTTLDGISNGCSPERASPMIAAINNFREQFLPQMSWDYLIATSPIAEQTSCLSHLAQLNYRIPKEFWVALVRGYAPLKVGQFLPTEELESDPCELGFARLRSELAGQPELACQLLWVLRSHRSDSEWDLDEEEHCAVSDLISTIVSIVGDADYVSLDTKAIAGAIWGVASFCQHYTTSNESSSSRTDQTPQISAHIRERFLISLEKWISDPLFVTKLVCPNIGAHSSSSVVSLLYVLVGLREVDDRLLHQFLDGLVAAAGSIHSPLCGKTIPEQIRQHATSHEIATHQKHTAEIERIDTRVLTSIANTIETMQNQSEMPGHGWNEFDTSGLPFSSVISAMDLNSPSSAT